MKYFILDLDSTIAKAGERSIFFYTEPRNFPAAEAGVIFDEVIEPTKKLVDLFVADGYSVIVMTARSANCRNNCISWLDKIGVPLVDIFLRPTDNYVPDYEIKEQLLKVIIEKYGHPQFALEDQPAVIEMFNRNGVFVFGIFNTD